MQKIHDITFTLSGDLTVWPDDTPISLEPIKEAGSDSRSTVSRLTLSSHAGTHVDAPAHFIPRGRTVEALDLEVLIGEALVVAVDAAEISAAVLETLPIPAGSKRVIFKTDNTRRFSGTEPFFEDYIGVTASGAGWLLEHGIELVGLDYLSVAAHPDILEVHLALLGAGIVLLETLDLRAVSPGRYRLVCLPLKLLGIDGSPARAILIEE